jgi:hypothetical protein
MTTTAVPAPVRSHLSRQYTNTRAAHARIVQAFDPALGWHTVDMPVNVGAVETLRRRGQTMFSVAYNKPHGGGRPLADFTVKECAA